MVVVRGDLGAAKAMLAATKTGYQAAEASGDRARMQELRSERQRLELQVRELEARQDAMLARARQRNVGTWERTGIAMELDEFDAQLQGVLGEKLSVETAQRAEEERARMIAARAAAAAFIGPPTREQLAAKAVRSDVDAVYRQRRGDAPQERTLMMVGARMVIEQVVQVGTDDKPMTVEVNVLKTPDASVIGKLMVRGELEREHGTAASDLERLFMQEGICLGLRKASYGGAGVPLTEEEQWQRRMDVKQKLADAKAVLRKHEWLVLSGLLRDGLGLRQLAERIGAKGNAERQAGRVVGNLHSGLEGLVEHWGLRPRVSWDEQGG